MRSKTLVNVGEKSRFTKAGDLYRVKTDPMTELLRNSRNACLLRAALLGEHGDLGERLGDHAEEDVVADLDETGDLALADVGDAPTEEAQEWLGAVVGLTRPRDRQRELARPDDLGLPLTGAARSVVPRSAARPRIFSETAAETVEQSMMIWGERVGGEKPVLADGHRPRGRRRPRP